MVTGSNKERLEQEIANLISFISDGRTAFFLETGHSLESSDEFINHFQTMELFQSTKEFVQLDLNIQLFYIKLACYYDLISKKKWGDVKTQRNAFAHDLTNMIFNKRVKYNFLIYKVSENFKKVAYLFYSEEDGTDPLAKTLELNLHEDINSFLTVWKAK